MPFRSLNAPVATRWASDQRHAAEKSNSGATYAGKRMEPSAAIERPSSPALCTSSSWDHVAFESLRQSSASLRPISSNVPRFALLKSSGIVLDPITKTRFIRSVGMNSLTLSSRPS